MRVLPALLAVCAFPAAAEWELGGVIGYGAYRNGSVFSPAGSATAGIRNRFVAGVIVAEDRYNYVSGEFRYLYQDGDPFLSSGATRVGVQGQSHSFHYDVLAHVRPLESRWRPYGSVGVGAKYFVTSGSAPARQPLERIGVLNPTNQVRPLVTLGGGLKYQVHPNLRLRVEFLDYITPFPGRLIVPGPNGRTRGILHQFTPMIGVSGTF